MPYDLKSTETWLVCTACGTQFPTADRTAVKTCFICDDPRQYTPPAGQSFTTLADIRAAGHRNEFHAIGAGGGGAGRRLTSIVTQPKLAIGQRAILIETPGGNILWDCLTLLDDATVAEIASRGGLSGIVISHPHYYSTHADWAAAFDCPVYLAAEDRSWAAIRSPRQVSLDAVETTIPGRGGAETGVVAVKLGGHFPGSLVLLVGGGRSSSSLLVADTLLMTPAGMGGWTANAAGEARARPAGMNTFAFMWSIPNFIPLSADELARMWGILGRYEFRSTHGAFHGQDIEGDDMKGRVLESMQIQTRYMGWGEHPLLQEKV